MYVAVLQSDVELQETNWLSALGESLNRLKSSGVKMVAPMTNNPMVASKTFKAKKGERREDIVLENIHLPMYCFLCHRELFSKTGLLSEFPYAGFEDQEYALRMKQKGYKQAVCGKSWVYHEGNVTLSKYQNNKKVQQIIEESKLEFFK
jgi:GT2 family glycosyltransferase